MSSEGLDFLEGKAMPDHLHMLSSVPPKYSEVMTMSFLKGKSAVRIHRELLKTKATRSASVATTSNLNLR